MEKANYAQYKKKTYLQVPAKLFFLQFLWTAAAGYQSGPLTNGFDILYRHPSWKRVFIYSQMLNSALLIKCHSLRAATCSEELHSP